MNKPSTLRHRATLFAAPILAVFIGYTVVFQMPLHRDLAQRLAKLHKLEEVANRRQADASAPARLVALQAEERSLALELENSSRTGAKLVTQRADRRAELFHTTSPASLVSQALDLLARHELECLDSSPMAPMASTAGSLESLKPVAELLGGITADDSDRRQVRIKLAGRFEDMQAAVRDMHSSLPDIFTVALEMEVADVHTHRRIWILTISV